MSARGGDETILKAARNDPAACNDIGQFILWHLDDPVGRAAAGTLRACTRPAAPLRSFFRTRFLARRTSSPSDDPAMASQRHRGKLTVACLQSPPRSPSPNHPRDVAGNPDAARCFVGRDSERPAPHGSPDPRGWVCVGGRPRAVVRGVTARAPRRMAPAPAGAGGAPPPARAGRAAPRRLRTPWRPEYRAANT